MTEYVCATVEEDLAEVALGTADGMRRAAVLRHVRTCAGCAEELAGLTGTANRIVELAPPAEPPPGFEQRVLAAVRPSPRRTRWRRPLAAAAAIVLIGAGGWAAGAATGPSATAPLSAPTATRLHEWDIVDSAGHPIGGLWIYRGNQPWMYASVDGLGVTDGKLTCTMLDASGAPHPVGTFTMYSGRGYWGGPLPIAPADATGMELRDGAGTLLATAHP